MTGLEWVAGLARLHGLTEQEASAAARIALERVDLVDAANKKIGGYSKGMRQRVKMAQALVHDPELLILDEPTNGLDPNQIRQIRELIRQLGQSHTVLISTHILHEVEMTCNRVIIIDSGKIKAADTPANLTQRMRTAGRIQVEIQADPEVVGGALHRLENVKKVTPEPLEDGWTRFTVWVDSGTDARERISHLASQYGWPLRSLFSHVATLEDVFVELTRRD
jgi:ABC-2 type transport system ATP-binding protein